MLHYRLLTFLIYKLLLGENIVMFNKKTNLSMSQDRRPSMSKEPLSGMISLISMSSILKRINVFGL